MKTAYSLLVGLACWSASQPCARAQGETGEQPFGARGTLVLAGAVGVSNQTYSDTSATAFALSIHPNFDYFVASNLALGGSTFVSFSRSTSGINLESSSVGYGAYAHVSCNIPLGRTTSLWPKLALGIWRQAYDYTTPGPGYTSSIDGERLNVGLDSRPVETAVVVELYAPVLVHASEHFFIGLGPDLYTDLLHNVGGLHNRRLHIGISSTVGGWL